MYSWNLSWGRVGVGIESGTVRGFAGRFECFLRPDARLPLTLWYLDEGLALDVTSTNKEVDLKGRGKRRVDLE